MSIACRQCGFPVTDPWANDCPLCLTPLQAEDVSALRPRPRRRRLDWYVLLIVLSVFGLMLSVHQTFDYVFASHHLGPPGDTDSTGRIRAGMPMHEVAQALDAEPQPADCPQMAESFDPGMKGHGHLVWARGGRIVRVRFTHGVAESIEEGQSAPANLNLTEISISYTWW